MPWSASNRGEGDSRNSAVFLGSSAYGSALSKALCRDESDGCCPGLLATSHVECDAVRAGMVRRAADWRWSSAASHLTGQDESGMLDMEWWRRESAADWEQVVNAEGLDSDSPAGRGCHLCGAAVWERGFCQRDGGTIRSLLSGWPGSLPLGAQVLPADQRHVVLLEQVLELGAGHNVEVALPPGAAVGGLALGDGP